MCIYENEREGHVIAKVYLLVLYDCCITELTHAMSEETIDHKIAEFLLEVYALLSPSLKVTSCIRSYSPFALFAIDAKHVGLMPLAVA